MKAEPLRPVITSRQLLYLMIATTFPTEALLLPSPIIRSFGKDALWAILGGGIVAILPLLLTLSILRRQRTETLTASLQRLGMFGKVVPVLFAVAAMLALVNIWASFAQLLRVDLLARTPAWVTTFTADVAVLYGAVGGPEVVGRIGEILVPIVVLEVPILFLLAIPWLDPIHMLPLLPKHTLSLSLGVYEVFTFLAEISFATYFASFVRDRQGIARALWIALGVNTLMLLLTTALPILMFGCEHAGLLAVPTVTAVRAIHYGFLVERLDAFLAAPWAAFVIVKLIIWTVFAAGILADAFGPRLFRWTIWASTIVASTASLWLPSLGDVDANLWAVWYQTGAPLALIALVVAAAGVRRGRGGTARA